MLSLGHILIAVDFSPISLAALRHALGIASRYRSTVSLLHVIDAVIYGGSGPGGISADTDSALRDCENLKNSLKNEGFLTEGLTLQTLVKVGPVWKTIKETAEQARSALLVLGTHGRTGFSKLLLGSVAECAFKEAPCPVLTVGSRVARSKSAGTQAKRFLVPTDLSAESINALPYGMSLATMTGGDVTLLHVLNPNATVGAGELEATRMDELLQEHYRGKDVANLVVERGAPADTIVKFADQHEMDMVVMGLRAWAPNGPAMWHTAYKVVTQARCPVLTLRSPVRLTDEAI